MCDSIIATADATADGIAIFGKNSDREPNEAQYLIKVPAANHPAGSRLRCTYIDIPQAQHTYAVLLSKPFWIWGAEMGANEHGVVIGNEAVFTKIPYVKNDSLIGMDLLRLGLERGKTAYEALTVITNLMAEHGQGGNCGFQHKLYYHNGYIIADPRDAWVMETAGPHWAAKQVKGVRTISNAITLGNDFDLASPDLVSYALDKGWCKTREDFHFAKCYSDFIYTRFSDSYHRFCRTTDLLAASARKITVSTVMAALRDHGEGASEVWWPDKGIIGAQVCMHAGFGPVRASQSVGSMVSHLHPDYPTHFFTGTSATCTSTFKPVWLDAGLPDLGSEPSGIYDPTTLYWKHEDLHRATLRDYDRFIQLYQSERDALEAKFVNQGLNLADHPAVERLAYSSQCFSETQVAEAGWLKRIEQAHPQKRPALLYKIAWDGFNRQARLPAS